MPLPACLPAGQRQLQQEQHRQDAKRAVTFKEPSGSTGQQQHSSASDDSDDGTPNRHSRRAIERRMQQERQQELTFKPDTSKSRKPLAKSYRGGWVAAPGACVQTLHWPRRSGTWRGRALAAYAHLAGSASHAAICSCRASPLLQASH
jgi:hypothetical protein